MTRIVSVWLKAWPIARLLLSRRFATQSEPVDPRLPLVLVAPGNGGARVVALNRSAQASGLIIGDLLSNARSKVHDLQTRDWDTAADAEALRKLALWAVRFTPTVACWDAASGADGLFLDVGGCVHLFGGEAALLADLDARLRSFGPLLLLPRPETADVTALIPDGPPRRFRWRGVMHTVAEAQGPERITPEWWRRTREAERDYYVVEDAEGRRFWLYRAGLYGASSDPRWFVHGTFA